MVVDETRPRFHLAFEAVDLTATRGFYQGVLGCGVGRESDRWIDFNFHGHQITAHLVNQTSAAATNRVDGQDVPVRHFGVILAMDAWKALAQRLRDAKVRFLIEPYLRFEGEVGEQATMFVLDPNGNGLEFKAFADPDRIFARESS